MSHIRAFPGLNLTASMSRAALENFNEIQKFLRDLGPGINLLEETLGVVSGSGGAPSGASFLTAVAEAGLAAHRVLAVQAPLTKGDSGAGGTVTLGVTFAASPNITYATTAVAGVAASLLHSDDVLQFPQALMPTSGGTDTLTLTQSGVDVTLTSSASGAFNLRSVGDFISLPKWTGGGEGTGTAGTILSFNALGSTMGGAVLNAGIQAEIAINEAAATYSIDTYGGQFAVDTRSGPTYTGAQIYGAWGRVRATGSMSGSPTFDRRAGVFADLVNPMGATVVVTESEQVYGEDNTFTIGTVGTYTNGYAANLIFPRTGTTIRRGYNLRTQSVNRGTEATDTDGFYCETIQKGTTARSGFTFEGATTGTPTNAYGFRQATAHAVGTNRYGLNTLNAGVIENPNGLAQNVLTLNQLATDAGDDGAHIFFNDKTTNPTALSAGQLWRNGDALYFRKAGSTIDLAAVGASTPTGSGFVHVTGGVQDAAAETVTFSDADQVTANQGTTTTVLHGNAAGQPAFAAVSLTADVSGTLPIGSGGTGQTGATAAFDALAPTTTQGDIIYHNGTDNVRLAKGAENTVLRMNATIPVWETELLSKDMVIENTAAGDKFTFFYTPVAITVSEVRVIQRGSSPSTTLQVFHDTSRAAAGTGVTTSAAHTSTTTGSTATLNDATIPAASYVWVEITAASGTINETSIHLRYTVDA